MANINLRPRVRVGAAVGAFVIAAGAFVSGLAAPALAITRGPVPMRPSVIYLSSKGWQGNSTYDFSTSTTSIFLHEDCPASYPVAVNGAFALNSTGQTSEVYLAYNSPRTDESPPDYGEWGWHFYWPYGSPAGVVGTFTLFCAKKE